MILIALLGMGDLIGIALLREAWNSRHVHSTLDVAPAAWSRRASDVAYTALSNDRNAV